MEAFLRDVAPFGVILFARHLREAAQVREMAAMYDRTDPGFAADLRAAAYRHEALHEAQIEKARTAKA